MPGIGITINAKQARALLRSMIYRAKNPKRLLSKIGEYGVSITKKRFKDSGPGWPDKHPYFAELQRRTAGLGSGNKPLTASGSLGRSITKDVRGNRSVRVGSPERYAALQNFGGPHAFYLYIIPDMVPGKSYNIGKREIREIRYDRNDYGYVLGRITEKQDWIEKKAVRQLMKINIRPREFIKAPSNKEWDDIARIAREHLFAEDNAA